MEVTEATEVGSSRYNLIDERMEELFRRAEQRLAAKRAEPADDSAAPLSTRQTSRSEGPVASEPYFRNKDKVAALNKTKLRAGNLEYRNTGIRKAEDPTTIKQRKIEAKKATAGPQWYNLPKTNLTPELKQDLQLLRMRSVLDPKRHYKKDSKKPIVPEFSQVGTLIEGPTEFFSARIPKRERTRTLVEDVLAGEKQSGTFTKKYKEIQDKKRSGKKGHYKAIQKNKYGNKMRK